MILTFLKKILGEEDYQKMFAVLKMRQQSLGEFLAQAIKKNFR